MGYNENNKQYMSYNIKVKKNTNINCTTLWFTLQTIRSYMIQIYFKDQTPWEPESLIWSASFLSFVKSKVHYSIVFTLRNIIISFRHLNYFLALFSASVFPEFISVSKSHKHKLPRQCSEQILHTCHKHTSVGKTKFQVHPNRVHCLVYTNFSYPTYLHE
jgi:hypothetical protein